MEIINRWEKIYGKVSYQGRVEPDKPLGDGVRGVYHGPYEVPDSSREIPRQSRRTKTPRTSSFAWFTNIRMK